jgi:hypothetical protein
MFLYLTIIIRITIAKSSNNILINCIIIEIVNNTI